MLASIAEVQPDFAIFLAKIQNLFEMVVTLQPFSKLFIIFSTKKSSRFLVSPPFNI